MRLSLPIVLSLALLAPAPALAAETPPPATPEAPAKTTAQLIDDLFGRLAKSDDEDESAGIVSALDSLWMRSDSDTSDLLMSRALAAFGAEDYSLALSLLDVVVSTNPDWAEGWNKRAAVRFHAGDAVGSAADVAETLARNPRHIGALTGLGAIFEQDQRYDNALAVYERALALAPHYKPVADSVARLKAKVAGQSL